MVSATLSGTCPTTPGHCPSPRILFRIDFTPDVQSIRERLSALVPHPASGTGRNCHAVSRVALPAKETGHWWRYTGFSDSEMGTANVVRPMAWLMCWIDTRPVKADEEKRQDEKNRLAGCWRRCSACDTSMASAMRRLLFCRIELENSPLASQETK